MWRNSFASSSECLCLLAYEMEWVGRVSKEREIKDGIEPEMEKVDRQNLLGPGAN